MTDTIVQTVLPRERMGQFMRHRLGRVGGDVWYAISDWVGRQNIGCHFAPVDLSNEGFYVLPTDRGWSDDTRHKVRGYTVTSEQLGMVATALTLGIFGRLNADVDVRTAIARLDEFIEQHPDRDLIRSVIHTAHSEPS